MVRGIPVPGAPTAKAKRATLVAEAKDGKLVRWSLPGKTVNGNSTSAAIEDALERREEERRMTLEPSKKQRDHPGPAYGKDVPLVKCGNGGEVGPDDCCAGSCACMGGGRIDCQKIN